MCMGCWVRLAVRRAYCTVAPHIGMCSRWLRLCLLQARSTHLHVCSEAVVVRDALKHAVRRTPQAADGERP